MIYVFDTSAFSVLFKHFYRDRFPSLWERFDALCDTNRLTSSREVRREIEDGPIGELTEWSNRHPDLFPSPTYEEARLVRTIFKNPRFRRVIEEKKILKGGRNADPFVIARAWILEGAVVTQETDHPTKVRIPTICSHFHIPRLNLEDFMEREGWRF